MTYLFSDPFEPSHRSCSPRSQAIGLVLLVAGLIFYCAPLYDCPCGGKPAFQVVGTPTEDRFEFGMRSCKACRGRGTLTMYDRWLGDPPLERGK